jgi:dipeptidyl aminopeptidase/acylaminoacyl peptidase
LYGSTWGKSGLSVHPFLEESQVRMGVPMADQPEKYIENSPVLSAKKVKTPLLLMHNINDGNVPFAQGVEFFTSLQRCGKQVWFLQYDKSSHTIDGQDQVEDYTKRCMQFFDFYLKGDRKMPCWMASTGSLQSKLNCEE